MVLGSSMLLPSLFCCSLKLSGRTIMSIPVAMVSQNRLKMQNHLTSLEITWNHSTWSLGFVVSRHPISPPAGAERVAHGVQAAPPGAAWPPHLRMAPGIALGFTFTNHSYTCRLTVYISIYYVWSDCPWKFVNWSMTKVEMFQILREWFGNSNLRSYNL